MGYAGAMPRTKKPKRGRPPLPPSEVRALPLPVRLTLAERDAFEAAAARAGLSLSAWVRSTLARAAGR